MAQADDKVIVLPLLESTADMEQSINKCIEDQFAGQESFELMAILAPTNAKYLILSFSIAEED